MGFLNKVLELQNTEDSLNIAHNKLNQDLGGLNKGKFIIVAGEPKSGKTKYVCETFILSLYLKNPNKKYKIYFYSLEIGLLETMANWTSYFIHHKYNYNIDSKKILGRAKDDSGNKILLEPQELSMIKGVNKFIVELLGEYDDNLNLIKEGIVKFNGDSENPTGLWKDLIKESEKYGKTITTKYQTTDEFGNKITKDKFVKFDTYDDTTVIVILDDIRLLKLERGFTEKQNIDKAVQYINELRLKFNFTFISTWHMNRAITDVSRLKYLGEYVYPVASDLKSSGDGAERATQLITIFNPCDPQYGLAKHFGKDLKNLYPNTYRSVHLVMNRDGDCPVHYQYEFNGKAGKFTEL